MPLDFTTGHPAFPTLFKSHRTNFPDNTSENLKNFILIINIGLDGGGDERTQREIARELGISRSALICLSAGNRAVPPPERR
ncbi:MAG: hypothetical protein C6P35_11165 [Cohnella sp.]|jgi:hypothetical protein|nr:MAG: hypothetical protein C6P35_11165 [Cohnella sp.]